MCSSTVSDDPLGDTLIINAGKVAWPIPLTTEEATAANWSNGSCFYSMGYHYFYDLKTAPQYVLKLRVTAFANIIL